MPIRKTSLRRRLDARGLTPHVIGYFFVGPKEAGCNPFSSLDSARAVWLEHEKQLMHWWNVGLPAELHARTEFITLLYPGPQSGRPWGWHQFSSSKPQGVI